MHLFDVYFLQVRVLHGVPALVQLFSSDNQEVQRFATGAMRNLIYENAENKSALIDAGGVTQLVSILNVPDEELRKNITGNVPECDPSCFVNDDSVSCFLTVVIYLNYNI